jgi:L-cysteine desulfidase
MKEKEFLKALLAREVVPATGCTEVGAVALATGWAVQALGGSTDPIEGITVEVDDNTYKNALGGGIPGTDESGLEFAAAMGTTSSRNVSQGLQILEGPDMEPIAAARALLAKNTIRIVRLRESKEILIQALSLEDVRIPSTDGIVGRQVTDTLENLRQIIEAGMPSMDGAIVNVMETKRTENTESKH